MQMYSSICVFFPAIEEHSEARFLFLFLLSPLPLVVQDWTNRRTSERMPCGKHKIREIGSFVVRNLPYASILPQRHEKEACDSTASSLASIIHHLPFTSLFKREMTHINPFSPIILAL